MMGSLTLELVGHSVVLCLLNGLQS